MFAYLCRDNTLVNIVAHYPDRRDQEKFSKSFPVSVLYRELLLLTQGDRLERFGYQGGARRRIQRL